MTERFPFFRIIYFVTTWNLLFKRQNCCYFTVTEQSSSAFYCCWIWNYHYNLSNSSHMRLKPISRQKREVKVASFHFSTYSLKSYTPLYSVIINFNGSFQVSWAQWTHLYWQFLGSNFQNHWNGVRGNFEIITECPKLFTYEISKMYT